MPPNYFLSPTNTQNCRQPALLLSASEMLPIFISRLSPPSYPGLADSPDISHSDSPSRFHRLGCLFLHSVPPYRCPADPLAPYMSIHCMGSLHCVTLYIVVNLPVESMFQP